MTTLLQLVSDKNRDFFKDQTHIYYLNKNNKPVELPGSDYASFEVVSYYLAKDNRAVYALGPVHNYLS